MTQSRDELGRVAEEVRDSLRRVSSESELERYTIEWDLPKNHMPHVADAYRSCMVLSTNMNAASCCKRLEDDSL